MRGFTSIAVDPTLYVSEAKIKLKDMVSKGLYHQTLKYYVEEVHPNGGGGSGSTGTTSSLLPSLIKACSSPKTHHFGLQLHCMLIKTGFHSEPLISNSLISMYAKLSNVECARRVFNAMPGRGSRRRDTITWNSIINCYTQNGYCVESLEMFKQMYACGFVPKPELIASIVSVCGRSGELGAGRAIHALAVVDGRIELESVYLLTAIVDMYMRCGNTFMASRVFDGMVVKNEVSWTAMISGCTANQDYEMALHWFRAMAQETDHGIAPNRVTLIAVLPGCAELGSVKHGKEIHGYAFRRGFESEFRFSTALIHMYCKCGGALGGAAALIFERSKTELKDVVMWSSIIGSYSQSRDTSKAMWLFRQMKVEGIEPNSVTLLAIISACTNLSSLNHALAVHGYVLKSGFNSHIFVANSLINMYSKCGCIMASRRIFREIPIKDAISWSALISGCGFHGCGEEALQLFQEMQERGIEPDAITFLAVLSACNHAGLLEEGQKHFNDAVKEYKISLTIEHYACHIDLLGRSGKIEDACEVVSTMPMKPSTRIWSSLVSACKVHGRLEVAKMLVDRLIKLEPENAANYTLLSMVYAESGNWLGVEEVRSVMRVRGLKKSYGFSRIELENGSL